jgi:hypothetical protein
MNKNTETTATKPASFPNGPEAFRDIAEKGTTQAKEIYENMTAGSTEAADLIRNSYSTAVKCNDLQTSGGGIAIIGQACAN